MESHNFVKNSSCDEDIKLSPPEERPLEFGSLWRKLIPIEFCQPKEAEEPKEDAQQEDECDSEDE